FLHSVYANDAESFMLARECMDMGAEFVSVHVSEDLFTAELEKMTHNMSAVALLDKYGLLSEKTILVHCGYCSDEDLMMVKNSGAVISVCPVSNKFLNTRMIDLYKLEDLGIPWCLSTDGLGTGRTFSLLAQVKCARKEYPDISLEKYWTSITSVPGRFFRNYLYTGNLEIGTRSTFIKTEYKGADANELIEGLVEGKIGYKTIKV
ncbi:MAG: amidohydrolase family protein, partial [Lachnospiraceae bacterium]|nr:amidohydrolase family protein [Lachnospiraceae bacterium]